MLRGGGDLHRGKSGASFPLAVCSSKGARAGMGICECQSSAITTPCSRVLMSQAMSQMPPTAGCLLQVRVDRPRCQTHRRPAVKLGPRP